MTIILKKLTMEAIKRNLGNLFQGEKKSKNVKFGAQYSHLSLNI